MSRLGSASPKLRLAGLAAAFASLYFVTAVLTDSLAGDAGIAVLWPASGVYLGVMLLVPHRMWPALACAALVGSTAAYLNAGSSLQVSIAFAVPSSAEGFLAALLVERIAGRRFTLGGVRDLFALVVGGALVANALIAVSAGAVAAQTFHASFPESWLQWWSADALGMLALAPILTAPLRPHLSGLSRLWSAPRVAALGGLGAALVGMQLVGPGEVADAYAVQAFLAVLLLSALGFTTLAADRQRIREELGRAREGTVEERDKARRSVGALAAELAARRAEAIQAGRGQERLTAQLRDTERERERAQRELADSRAALTAAKGELDALGRDLGLTVADRDRVRDELRESTRARERLRAELATATDELGRAQEAGQALEDELESARVENRALSDGLENARTKNVELENKLESADGRARALENELESASERSRVLEGELERAEAERVGAAEELARAQSAAHRLEEELRRTRTEHARSAEVLVEESSVRERLEEELQRARAEHGALATELAEERSARQRVEEELAAVAPRVEGLELQLERSRSAHQDAELALDHARAKFFERREQLERSLAEATERLARLEGQVADPAGEPSSRYDERGTCLSVSAAFAELLGYDSRELVGRPGHELLHPADRPRLARARATRGQTTFEARLLRKTGEFVWVEVSLDPVWSSGGERLVELRTTVRRLALAA